MIFNAHSYYSLRYGTMSVNQLIESAKKLGWKKLTLTDINNSTAIPEFIKTCNKYNIKAAAGIEFRLKNELLYIGLAKNNNGLNELNKFLSYHNLNKLIFPEKAPKLSDVFFIYPFSERSINYVLAENEYIAIDATELPKLFMVPTEKHPKLLAWQPFSFLDMKSFEVHKHLRAIDNNTLLSKLSDNDIGKYWHRPISPIRMRKAFYHYPFLLQNSEKIMQNCSIEMDFKTVKNKKHFTSNADEDRNLLRKLAYKGLKERYGLKDKRAIERVEKELKIIDILGFSAYFLITWDIIRYALSRGFYHVGRGSGANSVVAYCLKIVDVDPIELDLYFERFINPHRTSPPDFDIDFSWKNRNEIQKYLFDKYGKEHTALLGTISTFKGKSSYRELAKVYGLPKEEIDDFIKYPNAERHKSEICMKIHKIASNMSGMPNLRSIHAGGVLISEEPITNYTALDMPPKGFPTTQWDMYVAEDLGFEKIDVLSQRGIGHIIETVEIIKENKNLDINIHDIQKFKADEKIKSLLKSAETLGCFYIESPAMRGLITKLKCDNYLNLVAASSIIRPGVAKSGMMKEYIKRHHNPNGFKYLHPVMETQLKETYGIMVYQEDVLKVCHHFAGLNLGDSDILRRAMSGKTRSKEEFDRIVEKFHKNCIEKKYPKSIIDEVWRQIESFAGYSFSKAHSASYAVESYQSLFLKAYFPIEFITAVINNFGGFYQSWVYYNEAKRLGAKIVLPCANRSNYLSSTDGENIFIGFIHINNFERKTAFKIEEERKQNGEFKSLSDFVMRILPEIQQLLILIRIGAFSFTGMSKAKLMWTAYSLVNKKEKSNKSRLLFEPQIKKYKLPELENNVITDSYDEIELLGFTISSNYFDLLQTNFRQEIETLKMKFYVGCKVRMLGNLVTIKYVKTKKGDYMHFATFVDHKGNLFDSVHFANSVKTYPFRGSGIYLVYGEIVEEYGHFMIDVYKMAKMPLKENPVL